MDKKTLDRLEELFYNYGETSKHIGRVETDGKAEHMKKYEKLCKERDEARRELCAARRELCRNEAIIRLQRHRVHRDSEDVVGLAKEIAVERGWDCFKDHPSKLEISADEALKEMTRLDEEMGLL